MGNVGIEVETLRKIRRNSKNTIAAEMKPTDLMVDSTQLRKT